MPIKRIISQGQVPVKIYTDDVDPQALNQLLNVAQLPFVHNHVAAMPDVHVGIGATIGAVIPTKGAIIPAAVGVDIGCFTGNTKIPLLDGTERTLCELAEQGGEHWVYAIDPHHQITGAKAVAYLTRRDAPIMRVVLDNDAEILCTPDHRFMLREGSWREAQDLQPKTSLMPFYSRVDQDGYTTVRHPATGIEQRLHWALAHSGVLGTIPPFPGQRTIIHHADFNQANNHPDNLKFMGDSDHSAYHRLLVERNLHWQSPAFEENRKAALAAKAKTPEGHAYMASRGAPNITRYMTERPEHFKAAVAGNGQRGRKFLLAYNQSDQGRAKSQEISQRLLDITRVCPDCGQSFQGHLRLNVHKRWEHGYNHKVKRVEPLEHRADVYCLTVPGYENFALSAGVFVHNCGMNAVRLSLKASQLPDNLRPVRYVIEAAVPVGFTMHPDGRGAPASAIRALSGGLDRIVQKHSGILKMQKNVERTWAQQLGTLGGGNHFIELCLDENQDVWVMLHSGSRGIGNIIGRYFIELARKDMGRHLANLPDRDLAYLQEGAEHFDDYVVAVQWAQDYAMTNRREMMRLILDALARQLPPFIATKEAINCLAGETMIMTRSGNRAISELCGGEHELLTSGGQWIKAPLKSFGEQRLFAVTLSRSGVLKTIYATVGHRWITRNQIGTQTHKTTTELCAKDRLQSSFPPRADAMTVDRESVARGFVYGDGSIQGRWAVANFCGMKDEAMLPFFADKEPPHQYAHSKRILHLPTEWKTERPPLDSTPNILYSWLAGYFAADGDVNRTGRPTLASANRSNLEYVRQLCTIIGIGTFGIRTRMRTGFGKVETPLYLLGLMRGDLCPGFFLIESHRLCFIDGRDVAERRGWNVVRVEPTDRVEEVFCAVVEGTHSFALEDNILTSNCHHNYVTVEHHFGEDLFITRKGAIRAGVGDLGIIPGSMGAKSYIVRGKGEPDSFCSCAHGAGRRMSRGQAKKKFDPQDLIAQTAGVECRKDAGVIDEIPGAYKPIDEVMANQSDLVEVVHTLKQVVCVKG